MNFSCAWRLKVIITGEKKFNLESAKKVIFDYKNKQKVKKEKEKRDEKEEA